MKFSVITPCGERDKNRIKNLYETLRAQTDQDFEWVFACRDPQALDQEIIHSAVVRSVKSTVGGALDQALRISHGHYVVWVDADDYLKPDALHQLSMMINRTSANGFDLNPYPTYEPRSSFMKAVRLKDLSTAALPDYGGVDRDQVDADLRNDRLSRSQLLSLVRGPQNHERHFANQITLAGKAVPRNLALRLSHYLSRDNRLYPALTYAVQLLQAVKKYQPLDDFYYLKVHHNDAINSPSLSQIRDSQRWSLWVRAVSQTVASMKPASRIRQRFERYILFYITSYLYDDVLHRQTASSLPENVKPLFKQLSALLNQLDPAALASLKWLDRKPLMLLRSHGFSRVKKWMSMVIKAREWHQIWQNRGRGITKYLYFTHYLKRPVNSKIILFESFLGRNFSDSPKYIYRYLQKHAPKKYRYVWIADRPHLNQVRRDVSQFQNTTVVPRFGFHYMKYLATAKYFVFNMRQPKWFVKRPGMRFLETWHGTPLKHLVFDMKNVASASVHYKMTFYHQSRQWDWLITDNQFSYRIFKHAFMYPQSRMLKSGYPRNDVLYAPDRRQIAQRIKQRLGIPQDKKVILYAPTWRDNEFVSHGHYHFDLKLNVRLLERYLSDDYVLVLRTHYFITNRLKTSQFGDFVYDASNYDDISQLYLISDVLITDYSSVFFDYANLKRPILFYVYDYDTYAKVLRGFYLNMERDLPGPLIKTSRGLVRAIQNLPEVKKRYRNRYRKFNQRFNAWDDGHAAARAVQALWYDQD